MSRIPFSEFTESELRIFISALEHYTKDMHKSAYIYDICDSLLGEMKFNLESRIKEWNEVLGEVIREPFSRPTKRALDGACESCKLELTPSCPIRTGKGCDLYQPRQ